MIKSFAFATFCFLLFSSVINVSAFFYPAEIIAPSLVNSFVYVDNENGNDTNDGLSSLTPVKTITKAVEVAKLTAGVSYSILVAEGNYLSETFPLFLDTKNISIYGGYFDTFSDRDISNHQTSIRGSNNTVIEITDISSTISGIKIFDQTSGDATIYVDITDGTTNTVYLSDLEITDCDPLLGAIYALMDEGDNFVVSNNYIHNTTALGATIKIEEGSSNASVYQNFLYDNLGGLTGGIDVKEALVYNNIITKNQSGAGLYLRDDAEAYHNTVVNGYVGARIHSGAARVRFYNNLIAYNSQEGLDLNGTAIGYGNNTYHENAAALLGPNEYDCNPYLSNINGTDYSGYMLAETSLCKDTGDEIEGIDEDYFGNPRVMDTTDDAVFLPDPGAHEYEGGLKAVPAISNVSASPDPFSPNGDGQNDEVVIDFDINTHSMVTLEIIDETDVIRTVIADQFFTQYTTGVVMWDGTNDLSETVEEGDYTYTITASNSEGIDTFTSTISVNFGAEPPASDRCAGFLDVDVSDPLCPAIEFVKDEQIFEGYPDGRFQPEQIINRAETTKVILEGFDRILLSDNGTDLGFSDVIMNSWYMAYLRSAKEYGVVEGYPDGTFKPSQQVNRVEMLKIFMETSGLDLSSINVTSDPYPDTPMDAWFIDYVQFSKNHALVDFDQNGNFNPAQGMARGDAAELFYRFHQEGYL